LDTQDAVEYLSDLGYKNITIMGDVIYNNSIYLKVGSIPTEFEIGDKIGIGFLEEKIIIVLTMNKKSQNIELCDWLRIQREKLEEKNKSFSLRQVADRIGVSPSYLSKVERGERNPSLEIIRNISADLRLDTREVELRAKIISDELKSQIFMNPKSVSSLLSARNDHSEMMSRIRRMRDANENKPK